jgi:hypothetical protein
VMRERAPYRSSERFIFTLPSFLLVSHRDASKLFSSTGPCIRYSLLVHYDWISYLRLSPPSCRLSISNIPPSFVLVSPFLQRFLDLDTAPSLLYGILTTLNHFRFHRRTTLVCFHSYRRLIKDSSAAHALQCIAHIWLSVRHDREFYPARERRKRTWFH